LTPGAPDSFIASRKLLRIRIEVNGDCTSEEYDWSTAAMVRFTAGIDSTLPLTLLQRGNRNCSDAHPGQVRRPSGDDGSSLNGGPGQTGCSRLLDPRFFLSFSSVSYDTFTIVVDSSQGKRAPLSWALGLRLPGRRNAR